MCSSPRTKSTDGFWIQGSCLLMPSVTSTRWNRQRVRIFEFANLHVIRVSFPRNVVAGSFDDRDLHAGQQHVLLAGLSVPVRLHLRVPPSPMGAS